MLYVMSHLIFSLLGLPLMFEVFFFPPIFDELYSQPVYCILSSMNANSNQKATSVSLIRFKAAVKH